MAKRGKQTKADIAIARLTPEEQDYLAQLCREHANATDIFHWLKDIQPGVSYGSLLTWYNREFPAGERARSTNLLVAECRGLNPVDIHAASLAAVVQLTDQLMGIVVEEGVGELPPSLLGNLVELLREQRQSAQALGAQQRSQDRKALELAGGYRVAEIATTLARDTPNAEAVKTCIEGAISKLEEEV